MATKTKKASTKKTPKSDKSTKISCLDAAATVLRGNKEPMTCGAMIEAMKERKLWTSAAPTPHATLHSALMREINVKQADSRFAKVGRGTFALKQ